MQTEDSKQDWLYKKPKKETGPTQSWLGQGNAPQKPPLNYTPPIWGNGQYPGASAWWGNPYDPRYQQYLFNAPAGPMTGLAYPYGMAASVKPWQPQSYTGYFYQDPLQTIKEQRPNNVMKAQDASASKYPGTMPLWDQMQSEYQNRAFLSEKDPYWAIPEGQPQAPVATQQAGTGAGGSGGYGGGGYGYGGYGYPSHSYKPGGSYSTGAAVKKFWFDLLSWNNPQERVNG